MINIENPGSESRSEHVPQCKSSCEEQAGFDKNWRVKAYSLIAAALNAIYKATQGTNSPFKPKIAFKFAHLLVPLEQKTNSCTRDHPCNFKPRVVNTRSWRHCPNMGSYIDQILSKMQILEGYAEFESFCPHCAGLQICRRGNLASQLGCLVDNYNLPTSDFFIPIY